MLLAQGPADVTDGVACRDRQGVMLPPHLTHEDVCELAELIGREWLSSSEQVDSHTKGIKPACELAALYVFCVTGHFQSTRK